MAEWKTIWTGSYPNLCHGEWKLFKDGKELSTHIPFKEGPADTLGEYSRWYFDADYCEQWDYYEDGESFEEWKNDNYSWLASLAPESEWKEIYAAFQENDWRHGQCGGCI